MGGIIFTCSIQITGVGHLLTPYVALTLSSDYDSTKKNMRHTGEKRRIL